MVPRPLLRTSWPNLAGRMDPKNKNIAAYASNRILRDIALERINWGGSPNASDCLPTVDKTPPSAPIPRPRPHSPAPGTARTLSLKYSDRLQRQVTAYGLGADTVCPAPRKLPTDQRRPGDVEEHHARPGDDHS